MVLSACAPAPEPQQPAEAPAAEAPAAGEETLTIAFSVPDMAFPFFVFMESQVRDEAAKLGVEIGSTNLYVNAIGGLTVFTESDVVQAPDSGNYYENSSETTIEAMYGGGLSYFPDYLDIPLVIQVDYDNNRGVTGTIGWYW